jgi:hypothetical protein
MYQRQRWRIATTFLAAQRPNSALQTLRDMINTDGFIAGPR